MKLFYILLIAVSVNSFPALGQTAISNNRYKCIIPINFQQRESTRQNTDYSFASREGKILVLQTFLRTKAEEGIDAHYLSKEILQQGYSQGDDQTLVYYGKPILIDGIKAYECHYSNSKYPSICEVTIYRGKYVHLFVLYATKRTAEERADVEKVFAQFVKTISFID